MKIPALILNAITTADNSSLDTIRIGMVLTGAALIGFTGFAVIVARQPFDAVNFGGGAALIFGGGGFGLAAKSRDETALTPWEPVK